MKCEYKQNDGVMDYCTRTENCRYQNHALIKEYTEKVGENYEFKQFSKCSVKGDLTGKDSIDSKLTDDVKYMRENGVADLCMLSKDAERLIRNYKV